jgi:hypothetical protein
MVRKLLFATFLLAMASYEMRGQTACELTLTQAQEEFDAGRFYSVPALLEECLKKNQNREWEQRAFLLLAQTYLLLENPVKADESYLKVLQANPEYLTDETRDPIDLVYLSKKFTSTPIFSFSGRLGLNTSMIHVINDVRIDGNSKEVTEEYSMKAGFQGGVGVDYHYDERWAAGTELNYTFTSFGFKAKNLFQENTNELTDRQTWLMMPILVKYNRPVGQFRPYAYLGYSFNLLLSNKSNLVIDGANESPEYNFKDNRKSLTQSLLVGGGLKYKWGLRYFYADARLALGLKNLARPENRNYMATIPFPYVDDDFRMNNVFVSFGYIHPFYKPRKLKNARTKSVLRKTKGGRDAVK